MANSRPRERREEIDPGGKLPTGAGSEGHTRAKQTLRPSATMRTSVATTRPHHRGCGGAHRATASARVLCRDRRESTSEPTTRRTWSETETETEPREAGVAKRVARRASQALVATAACAAVALGSGFEEALAVSGGRNGNTSLPISNSDFSGQDLTSADFTKTIMKQCNFDKAKMRGVSLFASFAEGSTFRGADLSFADLEQGNFEGTDFTDAVLEGAQVSAARFERAIFDNTDWTDVVLRKDVQQFLCKKAKGVNPVTGADTRESLMCS